MSFLDIDELDVVTDMIDGKLIVCPALMIETSLFLSIDHRFAFVLFDRSATFARHYLRAIPSRNPFRKCTLSKG